MSDGTERIAKQLENVDEEGAVVNPEWVQWMFKSCSESELPVCGFSESDKKCWVKGPTDKHCLMCLLGQVCQALNVIGIGSIDTASEIESIARMLVDYRI